MEQISDKPEGSEPNCPDLHSFIVWVCLGEFGYKWLSAVSLKLKKGRKSWFMTQSTEFHFRNVKSSRVHRPHTHVHTYTHTPLIYIFIYTQSCATPTYTYIYTQAHTIFVTDIHIYLYTHMHTHTQKIYSDTDVEKISRDS